LAVDEARMGEDVPTVPALEASEIYPEARERAGDDDEHPPADLADGAAHQIVHDPQRRDPEKTPGQREAEHHAQVKPPRHLVAIAPVDQVREDVRGVGEHREPGEPERRDGHPSPRTLLTWCAMEVQRCEAQAVWD